MGVGIKLTKPTVAKLACPPNAAEAFFWDSVVIGFGLRIRASGVRRWVAQYRVIGGQRRMILGDPNTVGLEEARDKARELLAQVRLGGDPQASKAAARLALTVRKLSENYLAAVAKHLRPRTLDAVRRHLRNHAKPIHHKPATVVDRGDIAELLIPMLNDQNLCAQSRMPIDIIRQG